MKVLSAFIVLLLGLGLNAQVINDGGIEGLQLMTKVSDDLYKVQGSPYLTDEFQYGTLEIDGKDPIQVFLRYDVQKDIVEIKMEPQSEEIYLLANQPTVSYKLNNNNKIISDQIYSSEGKISGLFIEHFNGEDYKLLEKHKASISKPVKAKSSYESDKPAQIKKSSEFYLKSPGSKTFQKIRIKHKDVRKAVSSSVAKDYLSDNKIKELEDLVAFLQYLEAGQQ